MAHVKSPTSESATDLPSIDVTPRMSRTTLPYWRFSIRGICVVMGMPCWQGPSISPPSLPPLLLLVPAVPTGAPPPVAELLPTPGLLGSDADAPQPTSRAREPSSAKPLRKPPIGRTDFFAFIAITRSDAVRPKIAVYWNWFDVTPPETRGAVSLKGLAPRRVEKETSNSSSACWIFPARMKESRLIPEISKR